MILRENYISQIKPFIDKEQVKIITGIRRSGKSTVLKLIGDELIKSGINESQILYINFESFDNFHLLNAKDLYDFVKNKIKKGQKKYLLFDEIQEVESWEKAINSFLVDFDIDIYLTGSNSHLLSTEFSTYIAGRYVEFPIFTLSFKEFLQFRNFYQITKKEETNQIDAYIKVGGFPVLQTSNYQLIDAYRVVHDIYSSVILRDSIQRHKIRDIELLERVVKYAFDNIGNTFSGKNVADYFKSQQRKLDINTVYNYLNALESAFILYRVSRFDIKGKEILKTQEKFYAGDVSLIYSTIGYKSSMISGILENIVFLELKRRNYKVYIGKLDSKEVDFIAEKNGNKIYIQVAYKLESDETIMREFNNLLEISDQYPKYVVSLDENWNENFQGIKHVHLEEFLLGDFY